MTLHPETSRSNPARFARYSTLPWIAVFILVAAGLHLSVPFPLDSDTAYHAAVGRIIHDQGMLYSFPWTTNSWFADHYADKELLFHLLFVPVAGLDYVTAARVIGTITGALILLTTYLILRKEDVPCAGLWALVPLFACITFVYRFLLIRPHLLSISLALVVLWAASRMRLWLLAVASICYPLAYVAWHLPVILVAIAECSRFISTRRIRWQPLVVATCGITVGVFLHPNSLNLVRLFWIQIYDVLIQNAWGEKTGFDLGSEFLPETVEGWLTRLGITVVMLGFAIYLSWRNRGNDPLPLAFTLTAVAFALLTAKTNRFAEYFVPFTVVGLALSARTLQYRFLPHLVAGTCLAYTVLFNANYFQVFRSRQNDLSPAAVTLLRQKVPVGAQVFAPDWLMTGTLMLALPDRHFNVALDPTFFYRKDPELYRLWYKIPREAPANSVEIIRNRFKSRYVICYTPLITSKAFVNLLYSTPGVQTHVLDVWVVFDLGDEKQAGRPAPE